MDHADTRFDWALRTYGDDGALDVADGADRPGSTETRKFYGPGCDRKAAHDIARGTGPRCDRCSRLGSDTRELFEGPDPYQSEINDDDTIVLLCAECHQQSCDEI